jgi:hypothetical protein
MPSWTGTESAAESLPGKPRLSLLRSNLLRKVLRTQHD